MRSSVAARPVAARETEEASNLYSSSHPYMHDLTGTILRSLFIFYLCPWKIRPVFQGNACSQLLIIRCRSNGVLYMDPGRLCPIVSRFCLARDGKISPSKFSTVPELRQGRPRAPRSFSLRCLRRLLNYWLRWPLSIVRSYSRRRDCLARERKLERPPTPDRFVPRGRNKIEHEIT